LYRDFIQWQNVLQKGHHFFFGNFEIKINEFCLLWLNLKLSI